MMWMRRTVTLRLTDNEAGYLSYVLEHSIVRGNFARKVNTPGGMTRLLVDVIREHLSDAVEDLDYTP